MNNRPNWLRVGDRLINLDHVIRIEKGEDFPEPAPGADRQKEKEPCVIIYLRYATEYDTDRLVYFGEDNQRLRFWMDRNFLPEHDITKYVRRDPSDAFPHSSGVGKAESGV